MTVEDLPRTGIDVAAVPGHGCEALVLTTPIMVCANEAPTVTVRVGDPHPLTGVVSGAVAAIDQGSGAITYGPVLFATDKGGLVSVGASTGRFTYTPSVQARQFARRSAEPGDKVDTFTVTVADLYGRSAQVPVVVEILAVRVPPTTAATVALPFENGVVVGRIEGAAWDGAQLAFSLQNSFNPADSTAESAYSEKGGLVQLDPHTGHFIFVPAISTAAIPGLATDRFVVTAIDAQGGTADIVVQPLAHLRIDVETTGTSPNIQRGRLSVGAAENGPILFSVGRSPTKGTVQVDRNGNYVYTRTPGLRHGITAADSFTILGTDDYGRSITVATVRVSPPLATTAAVTATVDISESAVDGLGDQTTRGRITAAGADRFTNGTVLSAKGSSVKIAEDGTFTYSSAQNLGVGHAAAAVNALAADKVDTFTVVAEDIRGGCTQVLVVVDLHPYNNTPTQATIGGSSRTLGLRTGDWTTSVVDVDGDAITCTITQRNPTGVVSLRRNQVGAFTVHYESTSARAGTWHPSETFTIRYHDGHFKSGGTPAYVTAEYVF